MPADVVTIDISRWLEDRRPNIGQRNLKILVTSSGRPLGFVDLKAGPQEMNREYLAYEMSRQLPREALARLAGVLPDVEEQSLYQPRVSVVLCTADREDRLKTALDALAQLEYPNFETIVVDNRPGGSIRKAVENYPVTLVEERRRGLSWARNAGIRRTSGEIIAFTDDDCIPTADWLNHIVKPFADPQVMCVTGLVVPGELDTVAQELFEEYGGLGRGFEPKWFGREFFERKKLRAVPTWLMGATANAAFRKTALDEIGLFDVTLGVGTPTGCSEDTYAFYQLLRLGYECVYEPGAYVYHRHRADFAELGKQLHGYGRGHYAYHSKCLFRYGDMRAFFHMAFFMPLTHMRRLWRSVSGRSRFPIRLILGEMLGNALGPGALLVSMIRALRAKEPPEA